MDNKGAGAILLMTGILGKTQIIPIVSNVRTTIVESSIPPIQPPLNTTLKAE